MHDNNQQLEQYIHDQLNGGYDPATIRQMLVQHGWDSGAVDASLQKISMSRQTDRPFGMPHKMPSSPVSQNIGSSTAPKKYRLFRAMADAVDAIRSNFAPFSIVALITVVVMGVVGVTLGLLFLSLLFSQSASFVDNGLLVNILVAFGFVGLYVVIYSLVYAFMTNVFSLAIYSGTGEKLTVFPILKNSLKKILKVAIINFLIFTIASLPMGIMLFITAMLALAGQSAPVSSAVITLILYVLALVWLLIVLLRLALAPYVGLYEQNASVFSALKRSNHLLLKGGQWFVVKGVILVFIVLVIYALAERGTLEEIGVVGSIIGSIFMVALQIAINSVLVMLYKNRVVVRGDGDAIMEKRNV